MSEKDWILGGCELDTKHKVILITGACRSGKTLLSKLLCSMKDVEWIEEPYSLETLPVLMAFGLINPSIFKSYIYTSSQELFNDNILLRNGNFRPNDLSTVWNIKKSPEIFHRLLNVKTREDVKKYMSTNNPYFVLDLPEILPFVELIRNCFSDMHIIHVIRNPYCVALEIEKKQWFSTSNLLAPNNGLLFYQWKNEQYKKIFLPWWVEESDIDEFLTSSEYERGLLYWKSMVSFNHCNLDAYDAYSNCDYLIRYEDMVSNPQKTLSSLIKDLNIEPTSKSIEISNELHMDEVNAICKKEVNHLSKSTIQTIENLMSVLGYRL